MIELRTINKAYNRTLLESYDKRTQRAFLELLLCIENQKLVPKKEDNIWIYQISGLVIKLRNEFVKERQGEPK